MRPVTFSDHTDLGRNPVSDAPPARVERRTYSVPEAAAVLGISRANAYHCVRTGELRAVQFGRRIVIPAYVIDELVGPDSALDSPRDSA